MKNLLKTITLILFLYLLMLFFYELNKEDIKNKANQINYSKHLTLEQENKNKINELIKKNNIQLICKKEEDPFFALKHIKYNANLYDLYNMESCNRFLKNVFLKKEDIITKMNLNLENQNINFEDENKKSENKMKMLKFIISNKEQEFKFLLRNISSKEYSNSNLMLKIDNGIYLKQFLSSDYSTENGEIKKLKPYLILEINGEFFNGEEYRELLKKYVSKKIDENYKFEEENNKQKTELENQKSFKKNDVANKFLKKLIE